MVFGYYCTNDFIDDFIDESEYPVMRCPNCKMKRIIPEAISCIICHKYVCEYCCGIITKDGQYCQKCSKKECKSCKKEIGKHITCIECHEITCKNCSRNCCKDEECVKKSHKYCDNC